MKCIVLPLPGQNKACDVAVAEVCPPSFNCRKLEALSCAYMDTWIISPLLMYILSCVTY